MDQLPTLQVAERVPPNPELQTGVQTVPSGELATQSPGMALAIEGDEAHAVLAQEPLIIQLPEEQVANRVPENPELHTGVQVAPLTEFAVQSPMLPSGTVGVEAQG